MTTNISKLCADHVRNYVSSQKNLKLKASHARELVAAFFGYKSHAALLAGKRFSVSDINKAEVLVPDQELFQDRSAKLSGLPQRLEPYEVYSQIRLFLQSSDIILADVSDMGSLEEFITSDLLLAHDGFLMDELSGPMAELNAGFHSDFPYFENIEILEEDGHIEFLADGEYIGEPDDDRPYNGHKIKFAVRVTMERSGCFIGYKNLDVEANPNIYQWRDPRFDDEPVILNPKEQFLAETGGFFFGETMDEFQDRQSQIQSIRSRIDNGEATAKDIDELAALLGNDPDDEFRDTL
ncbi:MAG: hypothetical protein DHS20C09_18770 [marine bacterium B5-7]|nr:MAG: hypothetical protein DHS20C09_18770 [marine bacterium B5-7]